MFSFVIMDWSSAGPYGSPYAGVGDRLSANQVLAFYPYFVWYTIMNSIDSLQLNLLLV